MMFLLNELSLHNQYQSESDFIKSLKIILGFRDLLRTYQRPLYCGRATLGNRQVVGQLPLRRLIGNIPDKDIQRLIFQWIDKDGPFWDDDKFHSPDEYFADSKSGEIVTDTVLAEAAFQICEKMESSVVSFSPSDYLFSPVMVRWFHNADNFQDVSISNYWQLQLLKDLLSKIQPPIQSWNEFIQYVTSRFTNLVFLPDFQAGLKGQPFSHTIAHHASHLLSVIDELKTCFDNSGHRTKRGDEIIGLYFTGDRAKFSDESQTNKAKFSKDLTFRKEDGAGVFCPYHGKISYRYYRLHFSWPITKNASLYVAYLGPKITKE